MKHLGKTSTTKGVSASRGGARSRPQASCEISRSFGHVGRGQFFKDDSVEWKMSRTNLRDGTINPTSHTQSDGNRPTPHARTAWDHPLQLNSPGQGGRVQKPWPRRMPELNSTVAPTPRGQDVLSLKPNNGGTERFQPRSDLPLPLRARPSEPCLHRQPIPGTAPPSGVWRPRGKLHLLWLCEAWLLLLWSKGTPTSCPLPTALLGGGEIRLPRPRAFVHRTGPHRKIHVSDEDVRSHLPSSLSAAAFSRGNPLRPNVPTTAQADQ